MGFTIDVPLLSPSPCCFTRETIRSQGTGAETASISCPFGGPSFTAGGSKQGAAGVDFVDVRTCRGRWSNWTIKSRWGKPRELLSWFVFNDLVKWSTLHICMNTCIFPISLLQVSFEWLASWTGLCTIYRCEPGASHPKAIASSILQDMEIGERSQVTLTDLGLSQISGLPEAETRLKLAETIEKNGK